MAESMFYKAGLALSAVPLLEALMTPLVSVKKVRTPVILEDEGTAVTLNVFVSPTRLKSYPCLVPEPKTESTYAGTAAASSLKFAGKEGFEARNVVTAQEMVFKLVIAAASLALSLERKS